MYISIEQAIDIYNDLIDAKNGKHGFGGDVAEIYVYRLLPCQPGYPNVPAFLQEDVLLMEKKAAEQFHSICYIFSKKHSVDILIDNVQFNDWISKVRTGEFRFTHKVHVKVQQNENN
jgi:hypothetical protein